MSLERQGLLSRALLKQGPGYSPARPYVKMALTFRHLNDVHSEDAVVIGGAGQGQHLLDRDGRRVTVLDQVQSGFRLEVINCDDDAGLEGGAHFGEQGFAATRRRDVTQNLKDVSLVFF